MSYMPHKPVTAIIVGAGHRAFIYAKLALQKPELLKIVGVADPDPIRRDKARKMFGFPEENCFEDAAALAAGASALLIQWGMERTPSRFYTTQELKFYLIRGAQRDPALTYPNREWGYGTLDLYNSFLSLMTN